MKEDESRVDAHTVALGNVDVLGGDKVFLYGDESRIDELATLVEREDLVGHEFAGPAGGGIAVDKYEFVLIGGLGEGFLKGDVAEVYAFGFG